MTPVEIEVLVFYYYTATDMSEDGPISPAQREALERFSRNGFLDYVPTRNPMYMKTDKLVCYVQALCEVPEPVQTWVIPK